MKILKNLKLILRALRENHINLLNTIIEKLRYI